MSIAKRIRRWWSDQVFWWRFTHGRCTDCGQRRRRLGGTTVCPQCFEHRYPTLTRLSRRVP